MVFVLSVRVQVPAMPAVVVEYPEGSLVRVPDSRKGAAPAAVLREGMPEGRRVAVRAGMPVMDRGGFFVQISR